MGKKTKLCLRRHIREVCSLSFILNREWFVTWNFLRCICTITEHSGCMLTQGRMWIWCELFTDIPKPLFNYPLGFAHSAKRQSCPAPGVCTPLPCYSDFTELWNLHTASATNSQVDLGELICMKSVAVLAARDALPPKICVGIHLQTPLCAYKAALTHIL